MSRQDLALPSAAEKLWEKTDPAEIDILLATLPYLDVSFRQICLIGPTITW